MDPKTFDTLIDAVEAGTTLKASIREAGTSWRALSQHILSDADAASRYTRARRTAGTFYADRALDAAMEATPIDVQVKRLQVDTLKWRAAMADPASWGEKREVTVNLPTAADLHYQAITSPAYLKALTATARIVEDAADEPRTDTESGA